MTPIQTSGSAFKSIATLEQEKKIADSKVTKTQESQSKRISKEFRQLLDNPLPFYDSAITLKDYYGSLDDKLKERYKIAIYLALNKKQIAWNVQIIPHETARVRIDSDRSFYYNASYVDNKRFIICESPHTDNISRFWQMVSLCNVTCIVTLNQLDPSLTDKFPRYWPQHKGASKEAINCEQNLGLLILPKQTMEKDNITYRSFELTQNGKKRIVIQLHHIIPDGTGVKPQPMQELSYQVNNYLNHGTVLVHCQAGFGRSGTFVAGYKILEEVNQGKKPNIFNIVNKLREDRDGLVQTEFQYDSLYDLLQNDSVPTLAPSDKENISKDHEGR